MAASVRPSQVISVFDGQNMDSGLRDNMADTRIELSDGGIRIERPDVPSKDVADFLGRVPEPEREVTLLHAIEVGVFCLERARTGQDLEFVKRQVESLINAVRVAVEKIPEETQESLSQKIGTADGQVLAPVQSLVTEVSKAASDKIREVRDLLTQEIDPGNENTTLGKALRTLRNLLDPDRTDSIQGTLAAKIQDVTAGDGTLAKAVKDVVADAVKPLSERIDSLAKEVRGREAAAEALAQTTAKGVPYEEEIMGRLQAWGKTIGAEISHVGVDNRPGDITVRVTDPADDSVRFLAVIEVRDRQSPKGRKAVSDDLSAAMVERGATYGLYLSRSRDGLGQELGEWAEGVCDRGPWVACIDEHLSTAVRFLLVQWGIARRRTPTPTVDASAAQAQIERIRTALGRVKAINTKVTLVRGGADDIQQEAEALRDDVKGALSDLEAALYLNPGQRSPSPAAEQQAGAGRLDAGRSA
jgi:hypothetical protein